MNRRFAPLGVLALACLASCVTEPGHTYVPGIRVAGVVANEYDVELDAPGLSLEGETDYSSIEVGAAIADLREDGAKASQAEFLIGFGSFEDLDYVELAAGGKFYLPRRGTGPDSEADETGLAAFAPFASIHSVSTFLEEVAGVDTGVQLGLRLGVGLEWRVPEVPITLDIGADYTLALLPARSNTIPEVETELSGFALRVGLVFSF